MPVGFRPIRTDHAAPASMFIYRHHKWNILIFCQAYNERFCFAIFQLRHDRAIAASTQIECEFITELAIEIRDAGNALHHETTFGAPLMDHLELSADETAF